MGMRLGLISLGERSDGLRREISSISPSTNNGEKAMPWSILHYRPSQEIKRGGFIMHEITKELLNILSLPVEIHITRNKRVILTHELLDSLVINDNYLDAGNYLGITGTIIQNIVTRKLKPLIPDVDMGSGARSFIRELVIVKLNKKKCTKCRKYKSLDLYYKDARDKEGRSCTCIECEQGKRYDFNIKKLEFLASSNGCTDCGEKDPVVLEFDHVIPGIKEYEIAKIHKWDSFLKETAKCDIVCANCHKRRTAKAQQWYKHTATQKSD